MQMRKEGILFSGHHKAHLYRLPQGPQLPGSLWEELSLGEQPLWDGELLRGAAAVASPGQGTEEKWWI